MATDALKAQTSLEGAKQTQLINLMGLDSGALRELVSEWGDKPFRARQLMRWIHQHGQADFAQMTDLAKAFRARLQQTCEVRAPEVILDQESADGTHKWLFDVGRGDAIEAVFIPETDRGTLCISSQAGCTVGCPFCSTGHQGFSRNLNAHEIVGQLWWARDAILKSQTQSRLTRDLSDDENTQALKRPITNVVFMGMGEPLLNYDPVVQSLRIMLEDDAWGLSRRRVTVSTSGVVPMIDRLAQDCPVALAISLHAPTDALRDRLVPLNKKFPLATLLESCRNYLQYAPRDFITFEYIMLEDINDQPEHARGLIEIARQVSCKLNLIPFNPFPQSGLKRSSAQRVREFADQLLQAGVVTTVRKTRGEDIAAACGQLAGDVQDRTRSAAPQRAYAGLQAIRVVKKTS